MSENKPLILITNDDGYSAKGIAELTKMATLFGDVYVVAPAVGMSGMSQAISLSNPLRSELLSSQPGLVIHKLTGTPADCIKFGIDKITPRKPDVVLSGINHGSNATANVFYSGTMGAALEGAMNGIPSIGVSLCSFDADADFSVVTKHTQTILNCVIKNYLGKPICLNVNFPDVKEQDFKGIKVCRQANGYWRGAFDERLTPYQQKYYWLTGNFVNHDEGQTDTDEWALQNGFASVVPTIINITAFDQMAELSNNLK